LIEHIEGTKRDVLNSGYSGPWIAPQGASRSFTGRQHH
jgi:hypothetical protein